MIRNTSLNINPLHYKVYAKKKSKVNIQPPLNLHLGKTLYANKNKSFLRQRKMKPDPHIQNTNAF